MQLYGYPSTRLNLQEQSIRLYDFFKSILDDQPEKEFHLVTHILGGILARTALTKLTENQLKRFRSIVMLCPPNKGSYLATIIMRLFPFISTFIKPLPQLVSDVDGYVHQVEPLTNVKIGIIAAKFDAKTPPPVTQLENQEDFIIIKSNHTFILNHRKAKEAIINFLKNNSFT